MLAYKFNKKEKDILLVLLIAIVIVTFYVLFKLVDNYVEYGGSPDMLSYTTMDLMTFQYIVSLPTLIVFVKVYQKIMKRTSDIEYKDSFLFQLLVAFILYGIIVILLRFQSYPNLNLILPAIVFFFLTFASFNTIIHLKQIGFILVSGLVATLAMIISYWIIFLIFYLTYAFFFSMY